MRFSDLPFRNPAAVPCADMEGRDTGKKRGDSSSGAALVVVLAFVVMLTVLIVAFFSRAMSDRQIATGSANQTKTELFAKGAMNTILGDLKQEIVDGSTSVVVSGSTVYTPTAAANVVPSAAGSTRTNGLENLLKRSAYNIAFSTGANAANRAAGPSNQTSTMVPSLNGRWISAPRWNKPLLLSKANPASGSDLTPVGSFTPPDWILVARDGSNPRSWNSNMVASGTNSTMVVGRYAFAIYDEGGLLDANVAGYPINGTPPYTGSNSDPNTFYKGSPAFADLSQLPGISSLSPSDQQAVINSLVGWRNYATTKPGGSLASGFDFSGTPLTNFTTFMQSGTGHGYNGFIRTSGSLMWNGQTDRMFSSRQELISFLTEGTPVSNSTNLANLQNALQYFGTFTRDLNRPCFTPRANPTPPSGLSPVPMSYPNDKNSIIQNVLFNNKNSPSYGTPVVTQRFALGNLALFADPNAKTDPSILAKIKHYFGLSLASDNYSWTYSHNGSSATVIMTLDGTSNSVASLAGPREPGFPQEPDFFEVLQAAVLKGSLAYYNALSGTACFPSPMEKTIMQIGVDLIDQYDPDSAPSTIYFPNAPNPVAGIENLPYFSETMLWPYRPQDDPSDPDRFTLNAYLLMELWNPHQGANNISAPASSPSAFVPSKFRLCLDTRGEVIMLNKNPAYEIVTPPLPTENSENPNGSVQVTFNNSTRFQEPTVLDTGLVDAANSSPAGDVSKPGWNTLTEGGKSRSGFLVGTSAAFPDKNLSGGPVHYTMVEWTGANPHIHLQFQDQNQKWHDYQGAYTSFGGTPVLTLNTNQGQLIGTVNSNSPFDTQVAGDISFNTWDYICGGSLENEDPRGSTAGSPWSGQTTYGKSVRPGPGQPGAANPSGAQVFAYVPGNPAGYVYPTYVSATSKYVPTLCYAAMYNENDSDNTHNVFIKGSTSIPNTYLTDMDGVVRHGDGYYGADPYLAGNLGGRPIILNRPFRSVGEMGYAWRGQGWKSVNFFSPDSGDAGLLDFFSIDQAPVTAGKISLNTRQAAVLQAVLSGGYRIEPVSGNTSDILTSTDVKSVAQAIVAHTTTSPLASRADIVRDLLADPDPAIPSGNDVKNCLDNITGGAISYTVKAKREAFVRALADVGTTRTWNLLIDVVAQTGRYPSNATNPSQFLVEGEKRYWLHVAIDRYTGQVIDQQLEPVNE